MADENEHRIRFRELLSGPWLAKSQYAAEFVAPSSPPEVDFARGRIELTRVALTAKDQGRLPRMARVFAPHWEHKPNQTEMDIRESFDYAMGQLMLAELAIETGYVPLEVANEDVRKQLVHLLWSEGARRYLMTYDYVPVRFLAARVGVDLGLPGIRPPEPNPEAEVRFATFLSQHRAWMADPLVDEWLGFLDDCIELEDEQDRFAEFLERGKTAKRMQQRLAILLAGAERFVAYFSELFALLSAEELPRFGLMYAYWIARFYGLRLNGAGKYEQEDNDWSVDLSESQAVQSPELMQEGLADIARAWAGIRAFVERHAAVGRIAAIHA